MQNKQGLTEGKVTNLWSSWNLRCIIFAFILLFIVPSSVAQIPLCFGKEYKSKKTQCGKHHIETFLAYLSSVSKIRSYGLNTSRGVFARLQWVLVPKHEYVRSGNSGTHREIRIQGIPATVCMQIFCSLCLYCYPEYGS